MTIKIYKKNTNIPNKFSEHYKGPVIKIFLKLFLLCKYLGNIQFDHFGNIWKHYGKVTFESSLKILKQVVTLKQQQQQNIIDQITLTECSINITGTMFVQNFERTFTKVLKVFLVGMQV